MRKVAYCKGKTPKELMEDVEAVYREIAQKGFIIVDTKYVFEDYSWGAFIEYDVPPRKK